MFNTFLMLATQDDQVRCFARVAANLVPGGVFVMEAFVPDLTRFEQGQRVRVDRLDPTPRFTASMHDQVRQQIHSRHFVLGPDGIETYRSSCVTPGPRSSI